MAPGDLADCFALLERKSGGTTRDGKPFFRVQFRDARRTATAMIWSDGAWYADCQSKWKEQQFYKLRCLYSESPQYGSQLEIDRIRLVEEADRAAGFNPDEFFAQSRFDPREMLADLDQIARREITQPALRTLVTDLLAEHAEMLLVMSAAARNHHAFPGGYLEHVLSVTRTAVFLAEKYAALYPECPVDKNLVVAGAILHDIGKILELEHARSGAHYTPAGRLIGHILLGRDLIRDKARTLPDLDPETLLRLEHIVVSHQNLPEWGSPIPPHTLEALLVHYADDIDAKYQMMVQALLDDRSSRSAGDELSPGREFTARDNALQRRVFKGLPPPAK